MPNVTVVSPFRDAAALIPAYIERLLALDWPRDELRYVFVEGDSVDNTFKHLAVFVMTDRRGQVRICDCGQPRYGSVVSPERFKVLAKVFNDGLQAVDLEWSDYVLFLPCDIRYQPDLLTRLVSLNLDVVVPFTFEDGVFYDTWALSCQDYSFRKFERALLHEAFGHNPVPMTTVGGTMLSRIEVLRAGVVYTDEEVDRGYSRMALDRGFKLWADPMTTVEHGNA